MVKRINDILWFTFVFFILALPLSSYVSQRILVLLLILSVIFGSRKFNLANFVKSAWDILLYLLVIGLGVVYSSDKVTGVSTLETSLGLLVLAIIFSRTLDFDRGLLNRIFLFLTIGMLVAGLICLVNAVVNFLNGDGGTQVFFFYDFTSIIDSHPTYLAYYLIFAITYSLYALNYERLLSRAEIYLVFALLGFSFLLLTGGQTAFVSLFFVFSFFTLKYLLGDKRGKLKLTFAVVLAMLTCILFLNSAEQGEKNRILNDSWDRFELWRSGIFANPDFFFGVGTGDYKVVLNKYFKENHLELFAKDSLNSHNQFIQVFFTNGILGLIAISVLIFRPLYLAFKHNDQMGILVLFPFLIYGMTEVFLGRYQGVVFFALLRQTFINYYLRDSKPV